MHLSAKPLHPLQAAKPPDTFVPKELYPRLQSLSSLQPVNHTQWNDQFPLHSWMISILTADLRAAYTAKGLDLRITSVIGVRSVSRE